MRPGFWFVLVRWLVALGAVAGLLALASLVHERMRAQRAEESASADLQETRRAGPNVIKLGAELAQSHGLKEEQAQAVAWQERVPVYGRVVPNPRATMEIRAPFAGTLRAAPADSTLAALPQGAERNPKEHWPALGEAVEAGTLLGWLDIRVGPQERLDLESKRREARARLQGAEEVFKIQQERVTRFQSLEGPGALARADVDQALVQLAEARTQWATARAAVQQWEEALAEISSPGEPKGTLWSQALKTPAAGEITDLVGRPGLAVEAGALVARLVDFRRILVRLDLPTRILAAGVPATVELFLATDAPPALEGATNRPEPGPRAVGIPATRVGPAPQVDAASQFASYWYEADLHTANTGPGLAPWRPGLFVKAVVKAAPTSPRPAVAVPEAALLYHQGRALVYVRLSPGRFERREVQLLGREGNQWVLASGVTPGEWVVSRRAQVLLSEEFRSAADND